MRHSRAIVLLLCEAGLLLAKHTWAEPGAQGDEGARAGAWDRSHALEQSGKLDQARHLLMAGWGSEPDNYDVALRLAWLSLRARDYERAVELYRKARSLAGESPEAAKGLASALAGLGHLELERSENEAARAAFREALSIDPQQHDAREGLRLIHEPGPVAAAWIAYLDNSIGSSSHRGAAVFTQISLPMGSQVRVRIAYRYARLQERGALRNRAGQWPHLDSPRGVRRCGLDADCVGWCGAHANCDRPFGRAAVLGRCRPWMARQAPRRERRCARATARGWLGHTDMANDLRLAHDRVRSSRGGTDHDRPDRQKR